MDEQNSLLAMLLFAHKALFDNHPNKASILFRSSKYITLAILMMMFYFIQCLDKNNDMILVKY